MIGHVVVAIATFGVTNIDDLLILGLFFAKRKYPTGSVVAGQYVGIAILIGISTIGILLNYAIPQGWLPLLGVIPLSIGVYTLIKNKKDADSPLDPEITNEKKIPFISVASITIANGGDNISIYASLFAALPVQMIMFYVITFMIMTGLWCLLAYRLVNHPSIRDHVAKIGHVIFPWIMVGLGASILASCL